MIERTRCCLQVREGGALRLHSLIDALLTPARSPRPGCVCGLHTGAQLLDHRRGTEDSAADAPSLGLMSEILREALEQE